MGSDWYRVDTTFIDHPKTGRLEKRLNDPNAGMYVQRLWSWTSRFCVRGRFADDVVEHVEAMCRWRGDAGKLLESFLATGFVDQTSAGHYEVHDWWDIQGPLVEKAEKDAARKRRARRDRVRAESADAPPDSPRDGAGTVRRVQDVEDGRNIRSDERADAAGEPKPAPTTSDGSGASFWAWANDRRRASGQVGEHPPRDLSGWWSGVLMELSGDIGRAERAYEHFLADPHWRKEGCPFAAFRKQWPKYAGEHYGKESTKKPPRDVPASYTEGEVKL